MRVNRRDLKDLEVLPASGAKWRGVTLSVLGRVARKGPSGPSGLSDRCFYYVFLNCEGSPEVFPIGLEVHPKGPIRPHWGRVP